MGGRKGRDGLFPATSCIKIAGFFGNFFQCIFIQLLNRVYGFQMTTKKL